MWYYDLMFTIVQPQVRDYIVLEALTRPSSTAIFKSQVECVSQPFNKADLNTVTILELLHYTGGFLYFMMQISLCNFPVCFVP